MFTCKFLLHIVGEAVLAQLLVERGAADAEDARGQGDIAPRREKGVRDDLTLGGGEITPLELTTAYAVLANGGVYVPNTSIVCITNTAGEIIYEYEGRCPDSARLTGKSVSVLASGDHCGSMCFACSNPGTSWIVPPGTSMSASR